ncbi:hypothetical protein C8R45DRAFT_1212062, partial [Mycena sanguinolenta]
MFPPVWLAESLCAGLLEILFTTENREIISPCMIELLEDVILPATVYRSVVLRLQAFFSHVRHRDAEAIFCDSTLLVDWQRLVALVESRSQIGEEDVTGASSVLKVCDDLEASSVAVDVSVHITVPKDVNVTTGGTVDIVNCVEASYRADNPRDRSVLRALAYHEYVTQREEIEQKQHLFKQNHPGEIPCPIFDFTTGLCQVQIGPLESMRSLFKNDVDRATRSRGQIQLHFMKIMNGALPRVW